MRGSGAPAGPAGPPPCDPAECVEFHVVLLLPGRAQLLDLDARLFRAPARGFTPPAALLLPWRGSAATLEGPWGAITYRPWPADVRDRIRPLMDWRRGPRPHVSDAIERAIRSAIVSNNYCLDRGEHK